jgi:membrane protein
MSLKSVWGLLKETGEGWWDGKAPRLGAALAFYTMLSLAPLLVVVTAVAGAVFGEKAAQGQLVDEMRSLLGDKGAEVVQTLLANAHQEPGTGVLATVLGLGMLLFGATGVFAEVQDSLNTLWGVQPKPGLGVWQAIRDRFLSFSAVVGVGFLLLASLTVSTALSALGRYLAGLGPWLALMSVGHVVVSVAVLTLLFAMLFKLLPDVCLGWRDVWVGAGLTALLFTLGKYLIGLYLGSSTTASAYGASASFAVFLIWVYYSAQIFFFGAVFIKVWAKHHGRRVVCADKAEPVTEEARARQGLPKESDARVMV